MRAFAGMWFESTRFRHRESTGEDPGRALKAMGTCGCGVRALGSLLLVACLWRANWTGVQACFENSASLRGLGFDPSALRHGR